MTNDALRRQKAPGRERGQASSRRLGRRGVTAAARRSSGDTLPTRGLPVLAGEVVDSPALSFLTAQALEAKRKEQEWEQEKVFMELDVLMRTAEWELLTLQQRWRLNEHRQSGALQAWMAAEEEEEEKKEEKAAEASYSSSWLLLVFLQCTSCACSFVRDGAQPWRPCRWLCLRLLVSFMVALSVSQGDLRQRADSDAGSWWESWAVFFLGPCAQVLGRGSHVHVDMVPVIRCTRTGGWRDTHSERTRQNHHPTTIGV